MVWSFKPTATHKVLLHEHFAVVSGVLDDRRLGPKAAALVAESKKVPEKCAVRNDHNLSFRALAYPGYGFSSPCAQCIQIRGFPQPSIFRLRAVGRLVCCPYLVLIVVDM